MNDLSTPEDMPDIDRTEITTHVSPLTLCVVPFRLANGELEIGTIVHLGQTLLPTGDPIVGEALDDAARRIICGDAGRAEEYLEQLYTFSLDAPDRRQIVISYIALFRESPPTNQLHWVPLTTLELDRPVDRAVLDYAVTRLRAKFGYTNIAFHLLPSTFTLTELQQAYESVLQHPVDKRNFRRRMTATEILEDTGQKRRDGSHRPAALYRFASRDDQAEYLTPSWASARLEPERNEGA